MNPEQEQTQARNRVMKILAALGFTAVIIFGVWLAVQIVNLMPSAFSSLASIADSVYNYQEEVELTVVSERSVVNSNQAFNISWNDTDIDGIFAFSFQCADGVSVEVRSNGGESTPLVCEEQLSLGEHVTSIDVNIASERTRFADVTYAIHFISGDESNTVTETSVITVVNPAIPQSDTVAEEDVENAEEDTSSEVSEEDEEVDSETPQPETSTPTPTPTPRPTVIEVPTYEVPVSNPNGYTDLAIRFVAVGHLSGNDTFTPSTQIDRDKRGAFQFEITNIGTRTSDDWTFDALLPGDVNYTSPEQAPLKPQERVLFTLGFEGMGYEGINLIQVTIEGGDDTVSTNNTFTWALSIAE